MNIVIPMAGKSKRFFKAGYKKPKFLLNLGGKLMIERVVDLFDVKKDHYHFVINRKDDNKYGLSAFLKKLKIQKSIHVIKPQNMGPVFSLLQIADKLSPKEEAIINYCDFLVAWDYNLFLKKMRDGKYDGGLTSFKGFHPASLGDTYYAYIKTDNKNKFLELKEKEPFTDNRLNEHASTGTYYFRKWGDVVKFGRLLIDNKLKAGNEYYPSLMYNLMNEAGSKSLVFEVDKFICLGTPSDYQQYKYWSEIFNTI